MSRYTALVDGKAGAYGVVFPDLDGCVAMGSTVDEALANAADALRDWVEVTGEHGEHVPSFQPLEKLRRRRDVVDALAEGALLATIPLVRETGRPAKANLSLDSGILAAIDEEASRRKLTRSVFIEPLARKSLPGVARDLFASWGPIPPGFRRFARGGGGGEIMAFNRLSYRAENLAWPLFLLGIIRIIRRSSRRR